MRPKSRKRDFKYLYLSLLALAWLLAYLVMPRNSPYDGPFDAEPFEFDVTGLPVMSTTELQVLGYTLFELEARENMGPDPGTVFVLKNRDGYIRWTRLGAPELGRIQLEQKSARWFVPGGWVVAMKPEYTGSGEIYISPLGNFRFFFHRW
jgi:hypothetical protein